MPFCGLKQAPRFWYECLSTFLLENDFERRKIDLTLFIKRVDEHILLVVICRRKINYFNICECV